MTSNSAAPEANVPCEVCEGSGFVVIGRHVVSVEMAIDAGDRSMAGMDFGPEWGPCPECNGTGENHDHT